MKWHMAKLAISAHKRCECDNLKVTAGWISHRIPSFGFVIQENETAGKLDAEKLKSKGVSPGPLYSKIKAGESITTNNGEIIHPADVMGPSRPGRHIVILGDTYDNRHMATMCEGADVLVHEATLEDDMHENAIQKGHSTPKMAGDFAKECGIKKLILTHFSQRYMPENAEIKEGEETVSKLLAQGKAAFGSDNVIAAEDFMTITIPRKTASL